MKTIISESKQVHENAARRIKALLDEKPDAVIAFSAGRSMTGLFALLREMSARREVSFSAARVFAVTEFISAPEALTCRAQLERELMDPVGVAPENRCFPGEDNIGDYDALIAACGGLDLAVIGIGHNGHIGFNEPSDTFARTTHLVDLQPSTIEANKRFFSSIDLVPRQAYTMGIGTILQAKKILIAVSGKDKAEIVRRAFFGPVTASVPASILQLHPDVTLVADEDALSLSGDSIG